MVLPAFFCVIHISAIIYSSTRTRFELKNELHTSIGRYLHWTGARQRWKMFSSKPNYHSFKVFVLADGHRIELDLPVTQAKGFAEMLTKFPQMLFGAVDAMCYRYSVGSISFEFHITQSMHRDVKRIIPWGPIKCRATYSHSGG